MWYMEQDYKAVKIKLGLQNPDDDLARRIRVDVHRDGDVAANRRDGEHELVDLVCQVAASSWIPNTRQVYEQVARVLRPGGLYRVDFCNHALMINITDNIF